MGCICTVNHESQQKRRERVLIVQQKGKNPNQFKIEFNDGLPILCRSIDNVSSLCSWFRFTAEVVSYVFCIVGDNRITILAARSADLFRISGTGTKCISGIVGMTDSYGEYGKAKTAAGFVQTLFAALGWEAREKYRNALQKLSAIPSCEEEKPPLIDICKKEDF